MLKFRDFKVVSFALTHYDVYWTIEPTTDDIQEWQFFVERTDHETGDFTTIAGPLVDQYFLRDNTVRTLHELRRYIYRIRAYNPLRGDEVFSDEADSAGPPDLVAAEIIRNQQVLFQQRGIATWILARRTWGQRCPSCYSPILGSTVVQNCRLCWGTGYAGGYHRPVKYFGMAEQSETVVQRQTEDNRAPMYATLTGGPVPAVNPGDLVIDATNTRYEVTRVKGSSIQLVTVRQILDLVKIERGQVQDAIPLRVDTAVEILREPRNFTNPHNLEALRAGDTALDGVLRTYGYR